MRFFGLLYFKIGDKMCFFYKASCIQHFFYAIGSADSVNTDPKLRLVTLLIMFCIWEFTFVKARVRVMVSNIGETSDGRLDLENIQPSNHFLSGCLK